MTNGSITSAADSRVSSAWTQDDAIENAADQVENTIFKQAVGGNTLAAFFYLKTHRLMYRDKVSIDINQLKSEIEERMAQLGIIPQSLMVKSNKPDAKYPCPCCGFLVLQDKPGSHDICPICFWEDDLSQLRFPTTTGANHVSLIEAQANYAHAGVCELRFKDRIRAPEPAELRENGWRFLDPQTDRIEEALAGVDYGLSYPEDTTRLYYWRVSYWLR